MSTDDPSKRTPAAPFHPPGVGRYPAVDDRLTTKVEAAPSWAIKMQEGINANHKLVVEEIHGIRADVEALKAWRNTGKHQPLMILPDGTVGPKPTPSGELRRVSENDLKQDAVIAQILVKSAETASKVDGLVTTQTEQTSKLTKLEATVGASDKRKMEILEDVYKRGTSFLDSPTGRIVKGLLYLALASYAAIRGVHVGP